MLHSATTLPASLAQDLRIQKPKGPLFICEVSDNSLHNLIEVPCAMQFRRQPVDVT